MDDYFFMPYKLVLLMCELLGKTVIYVIPESVLVGKGANMVISLLHHFLEENIVVKKEIH